MPSEMPPNLVSPNPDDAGTPQGVTKRWPWSKPKVATKATLRERRQLRRAHKKTLE